jgi:hypothetical protein
VALRMASGPMLSSSLRAIAPPLVR